MDAWHIKIEIGKFSLGCSYTRRISCDEFVKIFIDYQNIFQYFNIIVFKYRCMTINVTANNQNTCTAVIIRQMQKLKTMEIHRIVILNKILIININSKLLYLFRRGEGDSRKFTLAIQVGHNLLGPMVPIVPTMVLMVSMVPTVLQSFHCIHVITLKT